jgi:hypothetical protein
MTDNSIVAELQGASPLLWSHHLQENQPKLFNTQTLSSQWQQKENTGCSESYYLIAINLEKTVHKL